jgi:hypothetical protein
MSSFPPLCPNGPSIGRRESRRVRVLLPASIETLNGNEAAELTSLSCTGAAISLQNVPKLSADLMLRCGSLEAFCTVVWVKPGRCGLQFEDPITETDVLSARRTSDHLPASQQAQRMAAAKAWVEGNSRDGFGA